MATNKFRTTANNHVNIIKIDKSKTHCMTTEFKRTKQLLLIALISMCSSAFSQQPVIWDDQMRLKFYQRSDLSAGFGEYIQNLRNYSGTLDGLAFFTNAAIRFSLDNTKATLQLPLHFTNPDHRMSFVTGQGIVFSDANGFAWTKSVNGADISSSLMKLTPVPLVANGVTIYQSKLDVNGIVDAMGFTIGGKTLSSSQWTTSGNTLSYSGNVGIGYATTPYKLSVAGEAHVEKRVLSPEFAGDNTKLLVINGGYAGIKFSMNSDNAGTDMFQWVTYNVKELMRLEGNGTLTLFAKQKGFVHTDGTISLTTSLDNKAGVANIGTESAHALGLNTNNQSRLKISADGNIDISAKFQTPLAFKNVRGEKVTFWGDAATSNFGVGVQDYLMQIHTDIQSSDIAFGYGNSTNFTERMRIKGNGNVGIGTTTPRGALDAIGDVHLDSGNVYIYGKAGKTFSAINSTITDKYALIVQKGILSEDFAMAPTAKWADYVFDKHYKLKTLEELESYLNRNHHLPDIPSQPELQSSGYSMHDMNIHMMEKIEELTLYAIEQNKINKAQQNEIDVLKDQLKKYEPLLAELELLKAKVTKK